MCDKPLPPSPPRENDNFQVIISPCLCLNFRRSRKTLFWFMVKRERWTFWNRKSRKNSVRRLKYYFMESENIISHNQQNWIIHETKPMYLPFPRLVNQAVKRLLLFREQTTFIETVTWLTDLHVMNVCGLHDFWTSLFIGPIDCIS